LIVWCLLRSLRGFLYALLRRGWCYIYPGATDLLDQLLSAVDKETALSQLLTRARNFLDNFSFPEAGLLLAEIEESLAEMV
jgi:hypothetical protein